jgi:hypothetical protein
VCVCVSVCVCVLVAVTGLRVYVCECVSVSARVCVVAVSVCVKREKRRDREGREKNKACFLLSHFQLCELQRTLHRCIELNFNPASSYNASTLRIHLPYSAVKAVEQSLCWRTHNFHQRHIKQHKKSPNADWL